MAKRYVKAYYDWIEQTAALSDAERGRLFIAILEYARSGLEPKLDGRESILFPVFRSLIDRDAETSATLAANGAKGGRGNKANESKIKQNKANESKAKPTKDIRHKTQDKDEDEDNTGDICAPARATPTEPDIPFVGELRDAVEDWLSYKRERREAYKPTGLKSLMTQITNAAAEYGDTAVAGVIRDSMGSGYKGIMFDRLHGKSKTATSTADRLARLVSGGAFG